MGNCEQWLMSEACELQNIETDLGRFEDLKTGSCKYKRTI